MGFEAHGSVEGAPMPQPVMDGGVIPSSTPAPAVTPKEEAAPKAPAQSIMAGAEGTGAPPVEYTPNFKFKVMDKEHEIPDYMRSVIKDAETEKKIRELHEKAYGLDFVKPRFHETREQLKTLQETHEGVMAGIQELRESYALNDFDTFFKKLNIPEEKILQWVIDKAQYRELPPEQRNVLDARKKAEFEALELRKQNQGLEKQYEAMALQQKASLLQFELAKPDVKAFAESFDSLGFKNAKGESITFWDAVVEVGEYAWYASKGAVDLSPEQAVREVMARYAAVMNRQQTPSEPPVIPASGNQPVAAPAPKKPATIPNVAGRQQSSVAKSKPKSLEDLKKLASQMGV